MGATKPLMHFMLDICGAESKKQMFSGSFSIFYMHAFVLNAEILGDHGVLVRFAICSLNKKGAYFHSMVSWSSVCMPLPVGIMCCQWHSAI